MMECTNDKNDPVIREMADQFNSLRKIVDELSLSDYRNITGSLVCDPAFIKLTELANAEKPQGRVASIEVGDNTQPQPDEPFYIEADIYDTGIYASLLVIPAMGSYIVVADNEHLATLVKSCDEADCWEQVDGALDDELAERIGVEVNNYLQSI